MDSTGIMWTQKDGTKILITEMTDKHLANSAMMLQRAITERQKSLAILEKERDRRLTALLKAEQEEASRKRRMSSLSEPSTRFIREDD